jgi:hypothetical protein
VWKRHAATHGEHYQKYSESVKLIKI